MAKTVSASEAKTVLDAGATRTSPGQPPLSGAGPAAVETPSFAEAFAVWTKIGLLNFGGTAGHIALLHRVLIDERRWISNARFLHALNYCMLLPGPEAQQLATYIGWLLHGRKGGLAAGLMFVIPGAAIMMALSALYALYGNIPLIADIFFGIKAAVLAIVIEATRRLAARALQDGFLLGVAAAAFIAIYGFGAPFPVIILAAAVMGIVAARLWPRTPPAQLSSGNGGTAIGDAGSYGVIDAMFAQGVPEHARPSAGRALRTLAVWLPIWLAPVALLWLWLGPQSTWTQIGGFFSVMAMVTFGGAYAALAYVSQEAVNSLGWLSAGEMLDGLALNEARPGPVILVLQFVGFLAAFRNPGVLDPVLAGCLGALLTVWVTFAPCFLWIFLGAPYLEKLRGNRIIAAALSAITAAVVGVMINLAVWFAVHVLFGRVELVTDYGLNLHLPALNTLDWRTALLAAAALVATLRYRMSVPIVLAACAAIGLLLSRI
jgi:chromate transporter